MKGMEFSMRHIIDLSDLTDKEFNDLYKLTTNIIDRPEGYVDACRGKVLGSLFYEPSTRTNLSFSTAMMRLGGSVVGFSDPRSSSTTKGETLKDTINMVSCYADMIVMRNPREGAAKAASLYSSVPVINAGDGGHLHPTQTLADMVTILRMRGSADDMKIGLCGDLKYGRTVHSLLHFLERFHNVQVYLIAPDGGETALPKNLDQYSAWTTAEVDSAGKHGLSLVNYHYPRLDITRVDFAAQAVQLYRVLTPDGQAAPDETPYSDCDDENVRLAAALGIVTGYEDGTFRPFATITREEAAAMLNRLYKILGGTQTAESRERYADDAQFGAWSRDSIYAMREIGIMKGEENNAFHPAGGYTGEQALVTMERLYNKLHQ